MGSRILSSRATGALAAASIVIHRRIVSTLSTNIVIIVVIMGRITVIVIPVIVVIIALARNSAVQFTSFVQAVMKALGLGLASISIIIRIAVNQPLFTACCIVNHGWINTVVTTAIVVVMVI